MRFRRGAGLLFSTPAACIPQYPPSYSQLISQFASIFTSGMFLHLEIQEGKMPMREREYSKRLGGTAGCSMRLMKATQYSGHMEKERQEAKEKSKREVFFGDSWFTSRRLCVAAKEELGHEYFGAMKTNHSGTPKEDVEKIMKDWPSGSYLVVECDELQLFMVGYKYSYKKKGKFLRLEIYFVLY